MQKAAARNNNRGFMHLVLGKLVSRRADFVAAQATEHLSDEDLLDPAEEQANEVAEVLPSDTVEIASDRAPFTPM